MYLYPFGLTNLLKLFSCTLYVRDCNGDVPVVVSVVVVCRVAVMVVVLAGLGYFCGTCVGVDLMPSLEIGMPVVST